MNKKDARREAEKRRSLLAGEYMSEASAKIYARLRQESAWTDAGYVFIYYGVGYEVRTEEVIRDALQAGKRVFLPKVISGNQMVFIEVLSPEDTEYGAFGIPEPVYDEKKAADELPDLVIVPCVAVDRKGNRAGHGRGYYDRYLKSMRQVPFICPAYDCQVFDHIETDDNDIRMDIIITEKEIIRV